MNALLEWLSRMFQTWKWWVVIPPWDIGVRIRLGKTADTMTPGLHFRLPFLDEIALVNTRQRIEHTGQITVPGSQPGKARVISAAVAFRITDPVRAMSRYSSPAVAVLALAQATLTKAMNEGTCLEALRESFGGAGVEVDFVSLVENVEVRTIRLMQGGISTYSNGVAASPYSERGVTFF